MALPPKKPVSPADKKKAALDAAKKKAAAKKPGAKKPPAK